jgi:hypothetical protein
MELDNSLRSSRHTLILSREVSISATRNFLVMVPWANALAILSSACSSVLIISFSSAIHSWVPPLPSAISLRSSPSSFSRRAGSEAIYHPFGNGLLGDGQFLDFCGVHALPPNIKLVQEIIQLSVTKLPIKNLHTTGASLSALFGQDIVASL